MTAAAIKLFLDTYMEGGRELKFALFYGTLIVNRSNLPKREDDWWLLIFLLSLPFILQAWVGYLPHPGVGTLAFCVWVGTWFIGFAALAKSQWNYNSEWHRKNRTAPLWWSYFTLNFIGYFFGAQIATFGDRPSQPVLAYICLLISVVAFACVLFMRQLPLLRTALSGGIDELPYRVKCKDINNMTAFELAHSFDHPGLQMTAAINTLRTADRPQLEGLLEIEADLVRKMRQRANGCKYGLAAFGIGLVLYILFGGQPDYVVHVLLFLLCLIAVLLVLWIWNLPLLSSLQHADTIYALSYIPSYRTIPALIRGSALYHRGAGYPELAKRLPIVLQERLSELKPDETVVFDELTSRYASKRLMRVYRLGSKYPKNTVKTVESLIKIPGLKSNFLMKQCLRKLAEGKSDDPVRAALQSAAREALE